MRPTDPPSPAAAGFAWKAALIAEIEAAAHALGDPDPDQAIHQTRVRLKRVRTLARLGDADGISRTARALKYTLSGWRDLTALENAARSTAVKARKKGAAALDDIAARLSQARVTLGRPKLDDLTAALDQLRFDALALSDLDPHAVRKGARRMARDARRAWRHAVRSRNIVARHRWRRRAKDRFYAATLLGAAWPTKRRRRVNDLLGDVLGRERDARLLLARLKSEPAPHSSAAKSARRALKRAIRKLSRRADVLGARLHRGKV
ncbi:MAG: CHAD domain-containing protein [Alphaproteobacteria bacterium]|nr:CHAD domain-containing protein [Alphaproteobacteria bacterium]